MSVRQSEAADADPLGPGLAVDQHGWAVFIRAHNLEHSMSRLGNCHDNAVPESFFSSLKRERIRRKLHKNLQ